MLTYSLSLQGIKGILPLNWVGIRIAYTNQNLYRSLLMELRVGTARTQPKWLKLISRSSAWLLLATVIVLVVSGWGITRTEVIYRVTFGLIDRGVADAIHRATNFPLAVFFISHAFANIRGFVSTKNRTLIWLTNIFLILSGVGLLAVFIIMENRV